MTPKVYFIEIRHVRQAVEALQEINLGELQRSAADLGSPADRALLDALLLAVAMLPKRELPPLP